MAGVFMMVILYGYRKRKSGTNSIPQIPHDPKNTVRTTTAWLKRFNGEPRHSKNYDLLLINNQIKHSPYLKYPNNKKYQFSETRLYTQFKIF